METLESLVTPEGVSMALRRRDRDYYLLLDGEELMSSRAPGSEVALAELAIERFGSGRPPQVLIGGLGLGYTLRAALDAVPKEGRVWVAEVFPEVVEWNRRHLSHLNEWALTDHRARVLEMDVWRVIRESPEGRYDVILLDVDNGPDAFCLERNRRLYDDHGLRAIHRALSPEGVLGIWSATPDRSPPFLKQLRRCGFEGEGKIVRSRGKKGNRHAIYLASKRPDSGQRGRPQSGGAKNGRSQSRSSQSRSSQSRRQGSGRSKGGRGRGRGSS